MDDFDSLVDDSANGAAVVPPGAHVTPTTVAANAPHTPQDMAPMDDWDSLVDDSEKYGTTEQMIKTGIEGAAHGIAGPLATLAEKHILGVKDEDMLGRQKANPITYGVGQAAGLGAGLLTGTGEAALMTKAGELAATAAGLEKAAEGVSLGYKVGSAAVQQAAEMAVLSGSDEVSKMILKDPDASAETAIANVGLAAVLGGATGAALEGVVSPLWKATAGPKVDELLNTAKSWFDGGPRVLLPDEVETAINTLGIQVSPEMRSALSGVDSLTEKFKILKEGQNPHITRAIDQLHTDASEAAMRSLGITADDVSNYSEAEAGHDLLEAFKKEYGQKYGDFAAKFDARNAEAATIEIPDEVRRASRDALLDKAFQEVGTDSPSYKLYENWSQRMIAKDTVGGMDKLKTEIGNEITKATRAGDFNTSNALTDIKRHIADLQENEILKQTAALEKEGAEFGSAHGRDIIRERDVLNNEYRSFAKMSDELQGHLGVGDFRGAKTLENKLGEKLSAEQLLSKFSFKNNADFIPFLQTHFPETLEHVKQNELKKLVKPAVFMAKGESPISVKKLADAIEKGMAGKSDYVKAILPPGAMDSVNAANRLLEAIPNPKSSGTAGWMTKMFKDMPRSAMGAMGLLMHGGAGGVTGALLGETAQRMGRDMPDATRLAYLKFMGSDQPIKAEGFKSMVDFFHNTYKGDNFISKATSNVFKAGAQVIGTHMHPDDAERTKLDKAVSRLQKNPDQMLQAASKDDLGHYLPNHQMAMSTASTRALQYLQSLKPQGYRPTPLDKEIPPSKEQMARYNRALDIAQQPALVLQHVKDGTLQATDLQDLNNLYPGLYKTMSTKLTNEIAGMAAKDEHIPYKTRMGVSLFLGQPMDSTMIPSSIMAAQPAHAQPGAQQAAQGGPVKGGGHSMKDLGKSSKTYLTASQASETDRANRKH